MQPRLLFPTLFLLLLPCAAEACGHIENTSPTEDSAMALAQMALLFYPSLLLAGASQLMFGDRKGRSGPSAWIGGATILAYLFLFLLGTFLVDSLLLGLGKYGRPGSSSPNARVALLLDGIWLVLVFWRAVWTIRSWSPRARSLRRLTHHPAWYLTLTLAPGVFIGAWCGDRGNVLMPVSGGMLLLPAFALIYHEVLYSVHRTGVWLRSRPWMLGASRLEELRHPSDGACPVCRTGFEAGRVACPDCRTPHHAECFDFAGGCAIFGCRETVPVPLE